MVHRNHFQGYWLFKTDPPKIEKKNANRLPSVVIGVNLAAHFSEEVIDACRSNNIKFLLQPPNTTDKMQPLDITFFGSMKKLWWKNLNS